jgi:hypothetical protein
MTNEDQQKLKALIYKLDSIGVNNLMVCQQFDRDGKLGLHKPKNWQKFIDEYIEIAAKG